MNISSIVIRTAPESIHDVVHEIASSEIGEVHFQDAQGRIVATIEGENISEEMKKLKLIQAMPRVVSAELAYSYSEDELTDAVRQIVMNGRPVPEALIDR